MKSSYLNKLIWLVKDFNQSKAFIEQTLLKPVLVNANQTLSYIRINQ